MFNSVYLLDTYLLIIFVLARYIFPFSSSNFHFLSMTLSSGKHMSNFLINLKKLTMFYYLTTVHLLVMLWLSFKSNLHEKQSTKKFI